jgi:outer membrane lipoprotein-sorting protein
MKKLFAAVLLLIAISSHAQDKHQALLEVSKAYAETQALSMDVEVTVYKDRWDKKGTLIGKGVMRKSKDNYYSRFMGDEMISNSSCTVIIDHSDKSIAYFKGSLTSRKPEYDIPEISAVLSRNDSVVYKGMVNGLNHYTLYYAKGIAVQTDIYVDNKTKFIRKMEYIYRKSTPENNYDAYKVVIEYKNISKNVSDAKIFSEKKYITYKKGQPRLLPAYSSYELTVAEKEQL